MDESKKDLLESVSPDRRSFIQRLVGMTGFAVPAVRTFVMGSAIAATVPEVYALGNTTPGTTTQSTPTVAAPFHSVRTTLATTTKAPQTTAGTTKAPATTPFGPQSIYKKGGPILPKPNVSHPGRKS